MGLALQRLSDYTDIMCGECGLVFYVPEHWRQQREENGTQFHCPNGHPRIYRETIEKKLRKELEQVQQKLVWEKQRAESLDKRLKAEEKKAARVAKRIHAGVCPHCQRTFRQLAAHMKAKHPAGA